MFESLFKYPTVLARHVEGPVADERKRFLLYRANEGAARETLLRIARELLVIRPPLNRELGSKLTSAFEVRWKGAGD